MALILRDGTVVPSYVQTSKSSEGIELALNTLFNNNSLHVGYLTAIHYPGDRGYEGVKYAVYDAIAFNAGPTGTGTFLTFKNCVVASLLGSSSDWEKRALRCPKNYEGGINSEFLNSTTKVLLLCVDGWSSSTYIVATDTHNSYAPPDDKSDGHRWEWVFNGINQKIDKDGQLTFTFNGPTVDEDNKDVEPAEGAGTMFQFQKDGSILLDDVTGDSIKIDKENKKIIIQAGSMEQTTTDGGWTVECAGDVKVHSKNVIINADGTTKIGSASASQNLVLGQQLLKAFSDLTDIFLLNSTAIGMLGASPVKLAPPVEAKIRQWKAKFAASAAASPLLAKNKFTE